MTIHHENDIINTEGIMGINHNGTVYLFRKNVFGDVTHIYDTEGNLKARYVYDAWGNHKVVDMDENDPIGEINPIRYRSYYYDDEIGLYYLRARYYDPETGRFISQDNISYLDPEHLMGLNLYAYCGNNPITSKDPDGCSWKSFWNGVGNWFKKIGNAIVTSIEAEIGAGPGISLSAENIGFDYYTDYTTIGYADGTTYTSNNATVSVGIGIVGYESTYKHPVETGTKWVSDSYTSGGHGPDITRSTIQNCPSSQKSTIWGMGPIYYNHSAKEWGISLTSGSFHFVFAGCHYNIGFNLSKFCNLVF